MTIGLLYRVGSPIARWRRPAVALEARRARLREGWSAEMMRRHQIGRLRRLLLHARDTVPLHRDRIGDCLDPNRLESTEQLERLPVLTKDELRSAMSGGRAISSACPPESLIRGTTTGSTGMPLEFVEDARCQAMRQGLLIRGDRWIGHRPGKRYTRIWRRYDHHSPSSRRRIRAGLLQWIPVTDVTDPVGSALGDRQLDQAIDAIATFRPHIIQGYASALATLARRVIARGDDRVRPERVVSSAEHLSDRDRSLMISAFRAKIHNLYGASEAPMIALDDAGSDELSVFVDYYHVELAPADPGEPAPVLITDLSNLAMPLVRYAIGDLAEPVPGGWPVGDPFPRLRGVSGRTNDVFVLPDGRRIFSHVWHIYFRDLRWVDRFEVVQTRPDHIDITFVTADAPGDDEHLRRIRKEIEPRFPGVTFRWSIQKGMPPAMGDKHRAVRSLVSGNSR